MKTRPDLTRNAPTRNAPTYNAPMNAAFAHPDGSACDATCEQIALIDRIAIALSALCIVHCIATLIVIATMASVAGIMFDPWVHELGLALAMAVAAFALGIGYRVHRRIGPLIYGVIGLALMLAGVLGPHGWQEVAVTVPGALLLGIAHWKNFRRI